MLPKIAFASPGVAFVVGDTTADELEALVRDRLAGYKIPKEFWFVDELPNTPARKSTRSRFAINSNNDTS